VKRIKKWEKIKRKTEDSNDIKRERW
jgi:hypothetical protein